MGACQKRGQGCWSPTLRTVPPCSTPRPPSPQAAKTHCSSPHPHHPVIARVCLHITSSSPFSPSRRTTFLRAGPQPQILWGASYTRTRTCPPNVPVSCFFFSPRVAPLRLPPPTASSTTICPKRGLAPRGGGGSTGGDVGGFRGRIRGGVVQACEKSPLARGARGGLRGAERTLRCLRLRVCAVSTRPGTAVRLESARNCAHILAVVCSNFEFPLPSPAKPLRARRTAIPSTSRREQIRRKSEQSANDVALHLTSCTQARPRDPSTAQHNSSPVPPEGPTEPESP